MRWCFCMSRISLVLFLVLLASPLFAQSPEERAGARALARQGAGACKAQQWEECIRYFTKAEQLVHAPPHR
jgi:hypothetical protein